MASAPQDPRSHLVSVRVLQLVADTDPDPATDAALALHQRLVDHGLEVRTLALAPGARPGHEAILPVIAPARRSLAARSGVHAERRWADVVVLHGPRVLVHATLPPRSSQIPTLYAGPSLSGARGPGGRTVERFNRRLAAVVTTSGSSDATFGPDDVTATRPASEGGVPGGAASEGGVPGGAAPAGAGPGGAGPEVLRLPIDAAAGAEWAALLRQLVTGAPRREG